MIKKVKAFDPNLQYPEVALGEGGDRRYRQGASATMVAQQELGGPKPWIS